MNVQDINDYTKHVSVSLIWRKESKFRHKKAQKKECVLRNRSYIYDRICKNGGSKRQIYQDIIQHEKAFIKESIYKEYHTSINSNKNDINHIEIDETYRNFTSNKLSFMRIYLEKNRSKQSSKIIRMKVP